LWHPPLDYCLPGACSRRGSAAWAGDGRRVSPPGAHLEHVVGQVLLPGQGDGRCVSPPGAHLEHVVGQVLLPGEGMGGVYHYQELTWSM
jgi:hypothetical protein